MGRASSSSRGNPNGFNDKKKAWDEDENKVFDRVPRSDGEEEDFAKFLNILRRLVRGDAELERELKERKKHETPP